MTTDSHASRGSANFPGANAVLSLKLVEGDGQLLANGPLLVDRTYGVLPHEKTMRNQDLIR